MKTLSYAIAISLITATSASAATSGLPGLTQEGNAKPKIKPAQIVYTGDGSGFFAGATKTSHTNFGRLSWSSWTASGAKGSGANWVDNCKPNCAQGKFTGFAVKLQASRPMTVAGDDVFTRLTVTYSGKKPSFAKQQTQTWKLGHSGKFFFWKFS